MTVPDLVSRELGIAEYQPTLEAMRRFTDSRDNATPDELWLLQHPPVYTQGQAGRADHLLAPGDIPVVQADRGGQVTYHGPGQWVLYLLLNMRRYRMGVRDLVDLIEHSLVTLLGEYRITAAAMPGAPGVYVDSGKIASLGLRVRRGCTYHGLALNVAMDLEPFARINPCGYEGLQVTSMAKLLPDTDLDFDAVGARLLAIVAGELQKLRAPA